MRLYLIYGRIPNVDDVDKIELVVAPDEGVARQQFVDDVLFAKWTLDDKAIYLDQYTDNSPGWFVTRSRLVGEYLTNNSLRVINELALP
jgi:hypothetical protein